MRAKEFAINLNIPINITMNADGSVDVQQGDNEIEDAEQELDQNPVMVPPLQQTLELDKGDQGKDSPVIDALIQDSNIGNEHKANYPTAR